MVWILNFRLAWAAILLRVIGGEAAAPGAGPATPWSGPVGMTDDEIRDEMAVW